MVNLIPKRKKKISKNQKILLYSLVFVLISLTVSYIMLMSFKNKAQAELVSLEEQIEAQKTTELSELEDIVQSYKIKVDQFGEYLNSHVILTEVFDFIEDNTHPHVFFSQFSLSSLSYTVNLSGQADSFLSLGQQLIIFNNSEQINGVSLSNISLSETGDILFNVRLTLDQALFRY